MPPLPLPATPLRRSERKRQPTPPALIGMIDFSQTAFKLVEGKRERVQVFPTTHLDIERLISHANRRLNVRYRYVTTSLSDFSFKPTELPLLYITGWKEIPPLGDAVLSKLARYLYDGGTLVLHAQCGREEFVISARRQIARLFPKRQLAPVDTDSPLFHAYFKRTTMRVRKDSEPFKTIPPYIEAVYLGCRPAIIFSPIDLNCGWDVVNSPIDGGILYHQSDAMELGVNIITTVLANFQYARTWGVQKIYHQQADETRDRLVIAQIVHGGNWDPTPNALPNLMKYIRKNTTLKVQFKKQLVDPANVDIFNHPVLYMTGLGDFKFTENQVSKLRNYLASGGVLLAESAAGRKAFDVAFRREIKRVLPKAELKILPTTSPIYQMPYKIRSVRYTPIVNAQHKSLNRPTLESIEIDNQPAVIYSSMSLSNGWEGLSYAYNRGYSDNDSLRLGVNIISYALTH